MVVSDEVAPRSLATEWPDVDPVGPDLLAVQHGPLPVAEATAWVALPRCGAVIAFQGVVRDHSGGRSGVTELDYEAYERFCAPCLEEVAGRARERWPEVGRIALIHRIGSVRVGEAAVLVAVSAPHREAAFEAARFCIDTVKAELPVWKREHWSRGSGWAACTETATNVDGGRP